MLHASVLSKKKYICKKPEWKISLKSSQFTHYFEEALLIKFQFKIKHYCDMTKKVISQKKGR